MALWEAQPLESGGYAIIVAIPKERTMWRLAYRVKEPSELWPTVALMLDQVSKA